MTVSELLSNIKNQQYYFPGSLILKSSDEQGAVYKWLEKANGTAYRKEIFIELNPDEEESGITLENKTVVSYIEIVPAI